MKKATFSINTRYRLCPHCQESVSLSTFYTHKRLYFKDGEWSKKHMRNVNVEEQEAIIPIEEESGEINLSNLHSYFSRISRLQHRL